ncbi:MAG: hypothetical protein ACRYHB_03290 [Janthinobacterium lividum]
MVSRVAFEVAGTFLVLFTLREVFRDIFHPTLSGNLSDALGDGLSLLLRHTRLRQAAGPLVLIAVLLSWIVLLCLGFAIIYYGLYPQDFTTTAGVESMSVGSRMVHCLYFSAGALCTFQTFDLNPKTDWLRLIVALQGLVGISMITASVSWLVLLYPALARVRATARWLSIAAEAEERSGLSVQEHDASFLSLLEQRLIQARLDLVLFPILLHFYALTPGYTLAFALPTACRYAREGMAVGQTVRTRLAATKVLIALEDLARTVGERLMDADIFQTPDVGAVFEAYADRER